MLVYILLLICKIVSSLPHEVNVVLGLFCI